MTRPIDSALRSLERLVRSSKTPGEIEASLARLDRRISNEIADALPEERRQRLEAGVESLLAKARIAMDRETEDKTRRALTRRTIREELGLPRLTLLGN